MKLYNKNLEEIENGEKVKFIENIVKKQIQFLVQTYGIDEKDLLDKLNTLAVVERSVNDKTYFVEYKGNKIELKNSGVAAAFATRKRLNFDGEKWSFENGIYVSDKNSIHKLMHELFHFLSMPNEMTFDENGIGYLKTGISIEGEDKDENVVDTSLKAIGLNEGITELLAVKFDGNGEPDAYDHQTYLADILINSRHTALVKAYFSDDKTEFENFIKEFDNRQKAVSSIELIELTTDGLVVANVELIKGCLEYSLSFCNNINELENESKRLLPILEKMERNLNIEFNVEQFEPKEVLNNVVSQRMKELREISILEKSKAFRESIKLTQIVTTPSTTNRQTREPEENIIE